MRKFNRVLFGLVLFCCCFAFTGGVKAEKFNMHFRCDNNQSDGMCNFSIVDGELLGQSAGCNIMTGSSTSVPLKISKSKVNFTGPSDCYKITYKCDKVEDKTKKSSYYEISKMTLSPTDKTKNDATNHIICPYKPLFDMCADYTEENFKSKCKNENANYKDFRNKCDLAYKDAMDYCEGKGDYISSGKSSSEAITAIRDRAIRDSDDEKNTEKQFGDIYNETTCTELLGGAETIVKNVFFGICIVAVVILIFTMSGDFIKAITSGDADAMAKAFKSSVTRIIAVIILLILPAVVSLIISVLNKNAYVVETTDSSGKVVSTEFKIGNISECNLSN